MKRPPLGQNFLIHRSTISKILQRLELTPTTPVLEIGPGQGALTFPLAQQTQKLLLIEKDPQLAQALETKFEENPQVKILNADFLKVPWETMTQHLGSEFRIVSNLPYEASTAILIRLLKNAPAESLMVLMFQREVAQRLTAQPRTKAYGSLTLLTEIFATVHPIGDLSPMYFRPPPKVWSSILKFKLRKKPLLEPPQLKAFEAFLHAGFAHRRKMLRQNLKNYFPQQNPTQVETALQTVNTLTTARAEELDLNQWMNLFFKVPQNKS